MVRVGTGDVYKRQVVNEIPGHCLIEHVIEHIVIIADTARRQLAGRPLWYRAITDAHSLFRWQRLGYPRAIGDVIEHSRQVKRSQIVYTRLTYLRQQA